MYEGPAMHENSGYHDCPCRDCFEIAIGCDDYGNPDLCHECEESGCDPDGNSDCCVERDPDCEECGDTATGSDMLCDNCRGPYLPTQPPSERARNLQWVANKLAAYAWPGGYPLFYVTADNGDLCAACANGAHGSEATIDPVQTDKQWLIVDCGVNWEDPDLYCGHCNERIESAYAEDQIPLNTDIEMP